MAEKNGREMFERPDSKRNQGDGPFERSKGKKKSTKHDMGNLGPGNEDQDKLISMLARHAESINGKMTDLLKRSEKLSENAKRLSGQIDTMLRE